MSQLGENKELAKKLNRVAVVLSIIILAMVAMMRRIKLETDIDFSFLPPFHSLMNALTAVVLVYALIQVKKGAIEKHRNAIYVAMVFSLLFLLSYVTYHITTEETKFGGEGTVRYIYFFLLITHVVLAAVIFPFILFTFVRGFTKQIEEHRKMARWVFPLWFYVAVTGPVLYLMLKPYY